jgi:AcrR family transcriptional regulator
VRRPPEAAEQTRRALIDAARALFAENGYAATPLNTITDRAQVTKGALYHHFRDKKDLFTVVFTELEEELLARINAAASAEPDSWRRLVGAAEAWLDGSLDPEVQQILLLDGPAVLSWETWREIDARLSLGPMQAALRNAMRAGTIRRQPVEPLAQLLIGALNEASLAITHSADRPTARGEVGAALVGLLDGLLVDPASNPG